MKTLKSLFVVLFTSIVGACNIFAQDSHNYFTSQVYPGVYARIIYGNNSILFTYPPNQYSRLNYVGHNNGINYYASGNLKVGVAKNGAFITTVVKGKTVVFNYIGPTSSYTGAGKGYSSPSYNNSTNNSSSRRYKCHFCDGTGKVTVNAHITQYSMPDYYVYKTCPICNFEYNATTTDHRHDTCSHCFGKGYIER